MCISLLGLIFISHLSHLGWGDASPSHPNHRVLAPPGERWWRHAPFEPSHRRADTNRWPHIRPGEPRIRRGEGRIRPRWRSGEVWRMGGGGRRGEEWGERERSGLSWLQLSRLSGYWRQPKGRRRTAMQERPSCHLGEWHGGMCIYPVVQLDSMQHS
jgi:hypothetical protein